MVFALLYFVLSIPIVGLMAITFLLSPAPEKPPMGFLIAIPFIYLVIGFVSTVLGAWVYNLVVGWVGGIEYTSSKHP